MPIRGVVRDVVRPVVRDVVGGIVPPGPPPRTERIANGTFADTSNWTTGRAVIVPGSPGQVNSLGIGGNSTCVQTLAATIPAGTVADVSINVLAHGTTSSIVVAALPSAQVLCTITSPNTGVTAVSGISLSADVTGLRVLIGNNTGIDSYTQISLVA